MWEKLSLFSFFQFFQFFFFTKRKSYENFRSVYFDSIFLFSFSFSVHKIECYFYILKKFWFYFFFLLLLGWYFYRKSFWCWSVKMCNKLKDFLFLQSFLILFNFPWNKTLWFPLFILLLLLFLSVHLSYLKMDKSQVQCHAKTSRFTI